MVAIRDETTLAQTQIYEHSKSGTQFLKNVQ